MYTYVEIYVYIYIYDICLVTDNETDVEGIG